MALELVAPSVCTRFRGHIKYMLVQYRRQQGHPLWATMADVVYDYNG